jgi:hypothetical protein
MAEAAEVIKPVEDSQKRDLRRKRHEAEVEKRRCWELRRNLADISAEVELITQEVCFPASFALSGVPNNLFPSISALKCI